MLSTDQTKEDFSTQLETKLKTLPPLFPLSEGGSIRLSSLTKQIIPHMMSSYFLGRTSKRSITTADLYLHATTRTKSQNLFILDVQLQTLLLQIMPNLRSQRLFSKGSTPSSKKKESKQTTELLLNSSIDTSPTGEESSMNSNDILHLVLQMFLYLLTSLL